MSAGATITLTATNGLFGSYYVGLDNAEAQAEQSGRNENAEIGSGFKSVNTFA